MKCIVDPRTTNNSAPDRTQTFISTMENFCILHTDWDLSSLDVIGTFSEKTRYEIKCLLGNAALYPDDYNLTARTYTEETIKSIGDTLQTFWLELFQKYIIAWSKDDIGEVEDTENTPAYNYINEGSVSIYPQFILRDIDTFIDFLKEIKRPSKELIKAVLLVLDDIETKILNWIEWDWSNEEIDIYRRIGSLYHEIKRLRIHKNKYGSKMCDSILAFKDGYLEDYTTCVDLWFNIDIHKKTSSAPLFFLEIISDELE